jgi:hypothetical protein
MLLSYRRYVSYPDRSEMARPHRVLARYLDAREAQDLDAIVALHTEDTCVPTHAGLPAATGRNAVHAAFAQLFERT